MESMKTEQLFDLTKSIAGEALRAFQYPHEALPHIGDILLELQKKLGEDFWSPEEGVYIHKTAKVAPTAFVGAPCIIDAQAEIRHGAFIRGNAIVGKNCVVGNSTELKNVILFDCVQAPHYNYVGDSILGYKSHMGAGSITSNVKADKSPVVIRNGEKTLDTGLKKMGAMLGDYAEIGCNAVLNPGTVIGRHSNVYPLSMVRGVVPPDSIYKTGGVIAQKQYN